MPYSANGSVMPGRAISAIGHGVINYEVVMIECPYCGEMVDEKNILECPGCGREGCCTE